jgi:hypothetical protein
MEPFWSSPSWGEQTMPKGRGGISHGFHTTKGGVELHNQGLSSHTCGHMMAHAKSKLPTKFKVSGVSE